MPTSFQQPINFRPKNPTRVDEFNFSGGLVTDIHETKLDLSQSPEEYNVTFNESGSIKTRNGYTRYNNDPQGASSDQSNFGTSTGTLALDDQNKFIAQTFQPSGEIECLQVDLSLAMDSSGESQRIRVELQDTSSSEPDSTLSQSQIKNIDGNSEATYSFRFRQPQTLSSGTTYAVVIKPITQGSVTSVNQVNVHHTGDDYASGNVLTSTDSGENWTADSAKDLKFRVYSGGDTGGTGLLRFYGPSGVQQLIAKIGNTLYRGNDSTGALASITLGSGNNLNTANHFDWTVANGTLLLVDGDNNIQKYRGSTKSNYSDGTIDVNNGSSSVTGNSTSWNANVETGEYIKLPDDKWYKITAVGSDTSITVEVDYQGSDASTESYTISPWGEVQGDLNRSESPSSLVTPAPDYIANHKSRIWTFKGNSLKFSALDLSIDGEHFNDWDTSNNAGEILISTRGGDTGTGLYSLGNSLYVFMRHSIWRVYGNSPANFEVRNVTQEIGLLDKRTLVEYNDTLTFLSDEGIYMFDGSNLKNISEGVINTHINSWANKTSPEAVLWDNAYLISYTPSGGNVNSEALFYDYDKQIFGKITNLYADSWSVWFGGTDNGEIHFISSNQGSIYKWDIGSNDDGYEIDTYYETPSIGFGANVNEKTMKRFYLQQLARGDYTMRTTMVQDIGGDEDTDEIDLNPGTNSLWDEASWDEDVWSSEGDVVTTRLSTFQGSAKYFKFKFEESGHDTGINILGMTSEVRTRRLV